MTDLENREAFEKWAYSKKWNIFRVRDMGIDQYVDDFVDGAWHGWQASTQRQGFKLVPLEPTEAMVVASFGHRHAGDGYCIADIYKAMIDAV